MTTPRSPSPTTHQATIDLSALEALRARAAAHLAERTALVNTWLPANARARLAVEEEGEERERMREEDERDGEGDGDGDGKRIGRAGGGGLPRPQMYLGVGAVAQGNGFLVDEEERGRRALRALLGAGNGRGGGAGVGLGVARKGAQAQRPAEISERDGRVVGREGKRSREGKAVAKTNPAGGHGDEDDDHSSEEDVGRSGLGRSKRMKLGARHAMAESLVPIKASASPAMATDTNGSPPEVAEVVDGDEDRDSGDGTGGPEKHLTKAERQAAKAKRKRKQWKQRRKAKEQESMAALENGHG